MRELFDDIVQAAHQYAADFSDQGPFDYSIESLNRVDAHLDELADYDFDENCLYNIVSTIGCYVFETARRNYGGEYRWVEAEQQPILIAGLPNFSVSIRAWEKVRGRILNGPEDNLPFYIQGYAEHIKIGQSKLSSKCDHSLCYSAQIH